MILSRLHPLTLLLTLTAWLGASVSGLAVIQSQNVVYASAAINAHSGGGTANLLLDIYLPDDPPTSLRPAMLLVHGGSFTFGSKTSPDMVDAAQYFASRGWVCFSINYRLVGDDPPAPPWIEFLGDPWLNATHAAAVDTKRAVRWLRTQSTTFSVDPRRVAALGHSAGAYAVLMAAISDEADFANDAGTTVPDLYPGQPGKVNACIEVSGDDGIQAADFDSQDPPLMIWHGNADTVVPYTQAVDIAQSCIDHQIPHRFFTPSGADHGAPTWAATVDGLNLKEHAEQFLNLFFNAQVRIGRAGDVLQLSWSSESNSEYHVDQSFDGGRTWTNRIATTLRVETDTGAVALPAPAAPLSLYRLEVLSGHYE